MPTPTKLIKAEKSYHVKDDSKRPLSVVRLRFHPTEARLVAVVVDCRLAVWDLDAPAVADPKNKNLGPVVPGTRSCNHEVGWIRDCALSPDGQRIVTGGSDRRLRLWPWSNGKPSDTHLAETTHEGWVEAVGFSPDGRLLASLGSDRVLKLWNAADLKPVRTLPTPHTGIPRDLCWTPDGQHLLTGGEDGKVIVWKVPAFEPIRTLDFGDTNDQQGQHPNVSGVHRLACSPDGHLVAAAGDRKLLLYDLEKGVPVATDTSRLQAAFHPSSPVLAAGGDTVKAWSYDASRFAALDPARGGKAAFPGKELGTIKLGDFALGLTFSPDRRFLALGKGSGTVELWQVV